MSGTDNQMDESGGDPENIEELLKNRPPPRPMFKVYGALGRQSPPSAAPAPMEEANAAKAGSDDDDDDDDDDGASGAALADASKQMSQRGSRIVIMKSPLAQRKSRKPQGDGGGDDDDDGDSSDSSDSSTEDLGEVRPFSLQDNGADATAMVMGSDAAPSPPAAAANHGLHQQIVTRDTRSYSADSRVTPIQPRSSFQSDYDDDYKSIPPLGMQPRSISHEVPRSPSLKISLSLVAEGNRDLGGSATPPPPDSNPFRRGSIPTLQTRHQRVLTDPGGPLTPPATSRQFSMPPKLTRQRTIETKQVDIHTIDGRQQINQYVVVGKLGQGMYGKVKKVKNVDDGQEYAMKIMSKSQLKRRRVLGRGKVSDTWENVLREIAIMKKLDHPNVVRLFEVIDDDENDKLFLVIEHMEHGAVMKGNIENDPLPIEQCHRHFRDLIAGLEYLHFQKVMHRDIKPENLLVDKDYNLKIADFGVSLDFDETDTVRNTAGSAAFMAPEMCAGQAEFSGTMTDIWSCGATLYMLVFGRCPFMANNPIDIYAKIIKDPLVFPKPIPDDLKDLLCKLMDKNPRTRITMKDIKAHPWVTEHGKNPMPVLSEDTPLVKNMVTQKDITGAWVVLVKLKALMHRAKEQVQARMKRSNSLPNASPPPAMTSSAPNSPVLRPSKSKTKMAHGALLSVPKLGLE